MTEMESAAGAAPRGPEIDQDILALADEIVQAARRLGNGTVGLQLDEGPLGRTRGIGVAGNREKQGGVNKKDGGEESVLFHESMLLGLTKIHMTRQ